MTKAELKTALEAKFDKVSDFIGGFPVKLGIARYDVEVYTKDKGFYSYSIHVDGEGTASEDAYFVGKNPLEEKVVTKDIVAKINDEIQARKTAGTIVDGHIEKAGITSAEVAIYTASGNDVNKTNYLISQDGDNFIFKKLV